MTAEFCRKNAVCHGEDDRAYNNVIDAITFA